MIGAIAWNAGAVSLGGMALYYLMLMHGTAARATANFYLVPGTAALMAWVFLGERLSALTLIGLAVSSLGCWLVSRRGEEPVQPQERIMRHPLPNLLPRGEW